MNKYEQLRKILKKRSYEIGINIYIAGQLRMFVIVWPASIEPKSKGEKNREEEN